MKSTLFRSANAVLAIALIAFFTGTISIAQALTSNGIVSVAATVDQSLTFTLNNASIAFGPLSTSAARYANTTTGSASETIAHTLALATNSGSGYSISVQGATLTASTTYTINATGATPVASSPGTEQFGIYATKAGGVNGTIDPTFATASSFGYDGTASTAATFATGYTPTQTETYSLRYLANIAPTTEAGSYSTSLTYVATANF